MRRAWMVAGVLLLAGCGGDEVASAPQGEREAGYLSQLGDTATGDRDWLVLGWDTCERLYNDESRAAVAARLADEVGDDAAQAVVSAAVEWMCPAA